MKSIDSLSEQGALQDAQLRRLPVGESSVFVIDGLFDLDFVQMLYPLLSRAAFRLTEYDTAQKRHAPHWNHEIDVEKLGDVPLLPELVSRARAATGALHPGLITKLVRMHCNLHLYGDPQYPHTDIVPGVTALYFANPTWSAEWTGETVFYVDDEPLYAITPKPGRLLVFSGDVVHRGGVPGRECFEPRISVALKFAAG